MYAIVDIETTGGFAGSGRITEVAIVIHDGERVIDTYESLINPEQFIPSYISGLTGIDQSMVESAPLFKEVAEEMSEMLAGKIFIAHNVHFDYSFLKREFENVGIEFNPKRLCTVRLSRNVFPGLRSYGLGNLCEQLDINIENRHRAGGDAQATAILFEKIIKTAPEIVEAALKRNSKETTLPPNLPKEEYSNLPELPGVYYFHDQHGNVIYVGKAINIKKRITGHFSGTSKHKRNQFIRNEIHHISFELTGNELVALLLESQEIKRLWPKYNQSQKVKSNPWAIYKYEDREGYLRFNVSKRVKGLAPLMTFHAHTDAWHFMIDKVKEFSLCPKLSGIQKTEGACYDLELGNCGGACDGKELAENYNKRVIEAILSFQQGADKSFAILGEGRTEDEQAVVLVEKGVYHGFGFCEKGMQMMNLDDIKNVVTNYKTTAEIDHYIQNYTSSVEAQIIELDV
ncbi:exonuclease domain-containing protein [Fulvivirga sediminis]|uniref:Excinuclease cho n=1 Tax=Fulvivirga sediminis TaxID=2803949 RepID=A0A937FAT8_9BACT|nr:exonuclease domain-containing protein [Fulvivirga sediminis]MBL3657779.1 GIY-YIG nuclease family protein [Fulvivirga sediminis]